MTKSKAMAIEDLKSTSKMSFRRVQINELTKQWLKPDTANELPIIIHHQGVHEHTFCDPVNFLSAAEFGSGVEPLIVFETMHYWRSSIIQFSHPSAVILLLHTIW